MANRIRELREARGLTLEQISERVETSVQQISRLERGDRRLTDEWMRKIARALGVPPAALLADSAPDDLQIAKNAEEATLLRFWRLLDEPERRWIAARAKEMGLDILAGMERQRRGSRR